MVKIKVTDRTGAVVPIDQKKRNIGVKVNEELWLRLRALAIRQGRLSGELLDEAIAEYLGKHRRRE